MPLRIVREVFRRRGTHFCHGLLNQSQRGLDPVEQATAVEKAVRVEAFLDTTHDLKFRTRLRPLFDLPFFPDRRVFHDDRQAAGSCIGDAVAGVLDVTTIDVADRRAGANYERSRAAPSGSGGEDLPHAGWHD